MIEIVIKHDEAQGVFQVYEPTTDTLLVTANLTESFVQLDEFLRSKGMIPDDILKNKDISYHIDSSTFIAMIESNVNLRKRLNSAPSGFQVSGNRFGISQSASVSQQLAMKKQGYNGKSNKRFGGSSTFSKTSFNNANKKFGGK